MTFRPQRMKFGVFMAPIHHRVIDNPTFSLEMDLQFLEHLDRLGYDEAWLGEHHSGAYEIYADPAILIGIAAQRTRHLKLGTGVVNLPLHHPYHVADRMVFLDHLTRGRAMLGVGSGALRADFTMLGLDPSDKHTLAEESLTAIMALLRAEEPVTMKTDWFQLKDARLQLASYTHPHLHVAIAGTGSESGEPMAGRHGLGQLTPALPRSGDRLDLIWERVEEAAAKHGQQARREDWRLMHFFHLAETREEALDDVRLGFQRFHGVFILGVQRDGTANDATLPEQAVARGGAIIGTPEDAIERIEQLLEQSGGFGGFLGGIYPLASHEKMLRSYELFARYVVPRFQGQYETMWNNSEWVVATGGGPPGGRPY